jgi:hypothetical protein
MPKRKIKFLKSNKPTKDAYQCPDVPGLQPERGRAGGGNRRIPLVDFHNEAIDFASKQGVLLSELCVITKQKTL